MTIISTGLTTAKPRFQSPRPSGNSAIASKPNKRKKHPLPKFATPPKTDTVTQIHEKNNSPSKIFNIASLTELEKLRQNNGRPLIVSFVDKTKERTQRHGSKLTNWHIEQIEEIEKLQKLTHSVDFAICDISSDDDVKNFVIETIMKERKSEDRTSVYYLLESGTPLTLVYDANGKELVTPARDHRAGAYYGKEIVEFTDPQRISSYEDLHRLLQRLEKGLGMRILNEADRGRFFTAIHNHDKKFN